MNTNQETETVWSSMDLKDLAIVFYPDPVLRKTCAPVTEFGPPLAALIERMYELMRTGRGVGLAAPQVGLPIRLFVCNPTGEPTDNTAYVNPELSDLVGSAEAEEGCLSLPEVTVPVRRAESLSITACDVNGQAIHNSATDLEARIWQHETDHLNGRLIIDYMSTAVELANRRVLKRLQEEHASRRNTRVSRS